MAAQGAFPDAIEIDRFFRVDEALYEAIAKATDGQRTAFLRAVDQLFSDTLACAIAAHDGQLDELLLAKPRLGRLIEFLDYPLTESRLVRWAGRLKLFVVRCPETHAVVVKDFEWASLS